MTKELDKIPNATLLKPYFQLIVYHGIWDANQFRMIVEDFVVFKYTST